MGKHGERMKKSTYEAALKNMKYYIKNRRFITVKVKTREKLGLCKSVLERDGIVRASGKNWFYIIENGFMTYYYVK